MRDYIVWLNRGMNMADYPPDEPMNRGMYGEQSDYAARSKAEDDIENRRLINVGKIVTDPVLLAEAVDAYREAHNTDWPNALYDVYRDVPTTNAFKRIIFDAVDWQSRRMAEKEDK